MMQKKIILALACGLFVTTSALAATPAGNTAGSYTVGVGADYYHFGDAKHLSDVRGAPFVSFGYNFTPVWGIRGEITRLFTSKSNDNKASVDGWLYNVDALYRFSTLPDFNLQPYAMAGAGVMSTKESGGSRHSPLNIDGGVGIQYFFASSMAFDLSVKDVYTFSQSSNDLVFGLGFDFNFGGSNSLATAHTSGYKLPPVNGATPADDAVAHFAKNSAKVRAEDKDGIKALANELQADKDARVQLSGYADDTGTAQYNMFLSQKRAESVKHYLKKDGVSADRIVAKGYGESNFITDDKSDAGRAANRRVEATIVE